MSSVRRIMIVVPALMLLQAACLNPAAAPGEQQLSATGNAGTLTVYVTSWFDLDNYVNKDVKLSGGGLGVEMRITTDGHHQVRCITSPATSTVSISTAPPTWVTYDVTCQHDQGGGG